MMVLVILVINVIIKLLLKVTSGDMLNKFMMVFVILVMNVIIKLLRKVISECM